MKNNISICTYACNNANEKRGHELKRDRRGVREGLEGGGKEEMM